MVQSSLILGTAWYALSKLWGALARSAVGRWFDALCRWVGARWRESLIVSWFCRPCYAAGDAVEPGRVRARLCALFEKLRLDRAFSGSIFLHAFFWCALSVVLAPIAPTMAVLALAAVGGCCGVLRALQDGERKLARDPLTLPVVVFALTYLVGWLTSVDMRGGALTVVLTLVFIFSALALYYAVDTREQFDLLTALMVTAGAAVAGYGILQYVFGWGYQSQAWVDTEMFQGISFRVGSTMENPNMLGQYLTLMIPLGGAKLLGAKGTWRKLYYLCCCGVMCLCMLLTFSRGAWLGLLFAGLLFFIALQPRLLFLAPFALLALYAVLPDTVVSRFTSIGNLNDHSTSYRVSIWMGTIAMLRDGYWLTGIGPGESAFNTVFPFYSYEASVAQHSHNLFLQMLCDAGIAELLAFLWVIVRYYRALGSALWEKPQWESRLMQIAFASGTLGFLVQAMTDYSFYNYRVMFLFWAYLSLGMLAARRDRMPSCGGGWRACL